jgi:hypothetical protein
MSSWPEAQQLRQCALAVAVMHDVDVLPSPLGVVLPGSTDVLLTWAECRRAIAGASPETEQARQRLKRWFQLRRWLADRPLEDLAERART